MVQLNNQQLDEMVNNIMVRSGIGNNGILDADQLLNNIREDSSDSGNNSDVQEHDLLYDNEDIEGSDGSEDPYLEEMRN